MLRIVIFLLAVVGLADSLMALRIHYSDETEPCYLNQKWDCGIVNHSSYSEIGHFPVAGIGIAGYLAMAVLALARLRRLTFGAALIGAAYAFYLAHIEKDLIHMWCLYCVISLVTISLINVLATLWAILWRRSIGISAGGAQELAAKW
jgi:vitamin-K-epoxide reductase (warfarin-sensitive)